MNPIQRILGKRIDVSKNRELTKPKYKQGDKIYLKVKEDKGQRAVFEISSINIEDNGMIDSSPGRVPYTVTKVAYKDKKLHDEEVRKNPYGWDHNFDVDEQDIIGLAR